ncbi:T9SS type A sorting domain-containing protein [Chryseobacterium pennipullorum]|uniref:T9SS C-terminal target domain-containing protein n=1 Tax=Chryseobacterium pennipullorum TaxID=2258963 RepID=A0A3D9B1B0_9FLAO|nr:T9SS type A sorting domain-containing protein [Chryseobacterium pennipullorum]REC47056.1 T9SS C-terminal target domain-containing protein [Chryseobacterium pennipullorum]
MKHLISIFLLLVYSVLTAQNAPSIQWQKTLGGSNGDQANSVQQTSDGGYIVAGDSYSTDGDVTENHGASDYWIVKLDAAGSIQWQKSLGGNFYDTAKSIRQTADGGYIVAGESYSTDGDVTGNHGGADYWIVKVDSSGNIEWQKSLGGSNNDTARSAQQTSDGGYIIVGESFSNDGDVTGNHGYNDYWVVKLDSSGNIQWQKSLGGAAYDRGNSIQQTSDGGYIIAGGSNSTDGDITGNHGNEDFWIVKLDSSGIIQWEKSLIGNLADGAESIQQTPEGEYIVAGGSHSTNSEIPTSFGESNYCVAKLDSNGTTLWQKYFGGSGNDYAYATQQTSDGGVIVAGGTGSANGNIVGSHGEADYWIIKLDSSGILQWQKPLGGGAFEDAYSMQQTADGGYIIAGLTFSSDGDITTSYGNGDCWIVKLNPAQLGTAESQQPRKFALYPNPARNFFHLENLPVGAVVDIIDMSGRKLLSQKNNSGLLKIEVSGFSDGVYTVQIKNKEEVISSQKLIIRQ